MATRKRKGATRSGTRGVRGTPAPVARARGTPKPYIDQEIVGGDPATNWNNLTAAMLAGRSVELIPILQGNRVRTIARTWLDYRADGSNDPQQTPPAPPLP